MKTIISTILIYWIISTIGFSQITVMPDIEENFISKKVEFFQLADIYSDEIWPGYKLNDIPIIFHNANNETGFLFNYPNDSLPDGYEYTKDYPGVAINIHDKDFSKGFEIGVEIGNQIGVTFDLDVDLSVISHESFHFYQSTRNFYTNFYVDNSLPSAEELTLIQIEQKYLVKALEQSDTESIKKYLSDFMNIRKYRYLDKNKGYTGSENRGEAYEGTAKYVECKFDDLISNNLHIVDSTHKGLHKPLELEIKEIQTALLKNLTISDYKLGIRYYFTGSAQCFVLDKLRINDWKKRMENGGILSQIIIDLIDFQGIDTTIINQIEKSREYKDIHAIYTKAIQEEQQRDNAIITDFNNRQEYKVSLCFDNDVADKQVMGQIEKVIRIEQGRVLFVDSKITYNSDFAEFEINGNIMSEVIDENQHFTFYWSSPKILLAGKEDYTANSNFEFKGGINITDENGFIKSDHCEIIRKDKHIKIIIYDKYKD